MIRKSVKRFSEKTCQNKKLKRDDSSRFSGGHRSGKDCPPEGAVGVPAMEDRG
jgi:hypothetical protein